MHWWVIRTIDKRKTLPWWQAQFLYFSDRTSLKNPRYLTPFHYRVKWFETRDKAEDYLLKKIRAIGKIEQVVLSRRKLHIDESGEYDYFRNQKSLMG